MEIEKILNYVKRNRFDMKDLEKMINDYASYRAERLSNRYRRTISKVNKGLRDRREKDFEKELGELIGDLEDKSFERSQELKEIKYKEAKRLSRERKKAKTSHL